jgi:methyl-accepting chemotaxis protein
MKAKDFGRLETSFSFHMIRDFFLLLLLVAAAEVGIRYIALKYEFRTTEQSRVERAAQQLADDIRAIMLNSGGPVAAQTVFPILDRNFSDLGLAIAILPSESTIESIQQTFKFKPQGLQPKWSAGEFNEASISIRAEQACLGCHVKAKVGESLGSVTVRSYLEPKQDTWWKELSVTASTLSFKIILHTIVLFLLLRIRMEPLVTLRATASALAKGVMNLSHRAKVNSADEFGELAADLNHFLDRVKLIVHDLDKILSEVVSVGERLSAVNRELDDQIDSLRESTEASHARDLQLGIESQIVAAQEIGSFEVVISTLDELVSRKLTTEKDALELKQKIDRLRQSFEAVTRVVRQTAPDPQNARAGASQYLVLSQSLREMALLEGSMQKVAESGRMLLKRIETSNPSS